MQKIFFRKCFLVKFLVNPWVIPDLPTFTKEILNRKVNIFIYWKKFIYGIQSNTSQKA